MRTRLLLIAAVTLTVGFSGSTSQPRADPSPGNPIAFGRGIYTTTGADYARIAELGFKTVIVNPTKDALEQIRPYGLTAMIYLGGYDRSSCTFGWSDAVVAQRVNRGEDDRAASRTTSRTSCIRTAPDVV